MSSRLRTPFLFAILLLICVAGATWLYFAPARTIAQIQEAAKKGDAEKLDELVDFPSVRASIKENLKSSMASELAKAGEGSGLGALGIVLANALVDQLVDAYVSPTGIAALSEGRAPSSIERGAADTTGAGPNARQAIVRQGYETPSKFTARLRGQGGDGEITFVLRRRGLSWRLTAIRWKLPKGPELSGTDVANARVPLGEALSGQNPTEGKDLRVTKWRWEYDDHGSRLIRGTVSNVGSKKYSYAHVDFDLYDQNGAKVAEASGNTGDLVPGATWAFEAIVLENNACSARLTGATGYR